VTATLSRVRLVDALHVARQQDASDVHLVPEMPPVLRVDGELRFLPGSPLSSDDTAAIARGFFADDVFERLDAGEDASITRVTDDGAHVLRVHGFRGAAGCTLAIRLLANDVPVLEHLHLPPVVASLARRERGLVIFAGATGSGKSTSLAALIGRMNAESSRRIITIEDPIEYRHENVRSLVTQREIGRDAPSFEAALIGALRADPDVIMLGEIRDAAAMQAALTAAETGHLVLATLHTGGAVQTIERIVDAFEGTRQPQIRTQLAQTLCAVVCQRLVPRKHGSGRRAVVEVLLANDAVRAMIREARTHLIENAMTTGRNLGMQTFEHHWHELRLGGEIA
jgi:twitching motility protein PilT